MQNQIRFTSFKLNNNKSEKVIADNDGYFQIILGGINIHNTRGDFYTAENLKKLFEESSALKRRIANGSLKSEVGHPIKEPGMSNDDFLLRWLTINDTNICGHISEIWLDNEAIKDQSAVGAIAVVGKVKPSGIFASVLESAFANPKENVAFSVRGFTEDKNVGGKKMRTLKTIITYDHVNEPGIPPANKFYSSNKNIGVSSESIYDNFLTDSHMKKLREIAEENNIAAEHIDKGLIEDIRTCLPRNTKPIFTRW